MNNFGRVIEFYVADRVWKYPELDMEFEIEFDAESNGNTGNIKIYNLSDKSLQKLKKGNEFKLKAGYKNDIGTIMKGKISSSETKFDKGTKITKVVLEEDISVLIDTKINMTWAKDIRSNTIIRDIIGETGLTIGDLEIDDDKKYPKGKTFSCDAKKALEELAKDTKCKMHISRGKIYFTPKDKSIYNVMKLNKDNGLIASPQEIDNEDEKRWKVQSLLRYEAEADIILDIESSTINGRYKVVKGNHNSDFVTECEVVKFAA